MGKQAEEEAAKEEAAEEAAKKQAEEDAATRQAAEEAAEKQAAEEAAKKQAEEEVAKKEAEERAAKKQAEEEEVVAMDVSEVMPQPTTPASDAVDEAKLQVLEQMGFMDRDLNAALLIAHSGDVQAALEELLAQ